MLALYRCGRQAEALTAFAEARRVLVRELGIEPGQELRALHARILAADPGLDAPVVVESGSGSGTGAGVGRPASVRDRPVPAQLPADVAAFTGRDGGAGGSRLAAGRRSVASGVAGSPGVVGAAGADRGPGGYRRGGQDRARGALGAPGGSRVPRRPALREPARLRPGRAGAAGGRPGRVPAGARPGRRGHPGRGRRARGRLPQPARRPPDAGRARQRRQRGASPPAAARQPVLPGGGDQPRLAGRAGRAARGAAARRSTCCPPPTRSGCCGR